MRRIFFKSSSNSPHTMFATRQVLPYQNFTESLMEENIEKARSLIIKWDPDASTYDSVTSLFCDNRQDVEDYLNAVRDLHFAMQQVIVVYSSSDNLAHAQKLMRTAMKRLQKEFYQIISSQKYNLNSDSVSGLDDYYNQDEFQTGGESVLEIERVSMMATSDLKTIADCMISTGYGKECVKIYKDTRKSIVDESLYNLGVEPKSLSQSQLQKVNWEIIELKIKNWLNAIEVAVKTLFYNERKLCDHVFSSSEAITVSCFTEICKDGAMALFGFPELVAKHKKTPEKMFRTLDLYESISKLWIDIEFIFSFESTSTIRLQAAACMVKLGESVRKMFSDLESAIERDTSKTPIPSGGVHPLTRYVMNYISLLSEYIVAFNDIFADWPLTIQTPLAESFFGNLIDEDDMSSPASIRFAWLVLVLQCKLDLKAELYNDVALSYLFLANNLQYIVAKVGSSNLKPIFREDWMVWHESKIRQYVSNYVRMGWDKVLSCLPQNFKVEMSPEDSRVCLRKFHAAVSSLPQNSNAEMSPEDARERFRKCNGVLSGLLQNLKAEMSPEDARECFRKFNIAFEEACKKQTSWLVPNPKFRDFIKVSIERKVVAAYLDLYEKYRVEFRSEALIKFAPEDLGNHLSRILHGSGCSDIVSSSSYIHRIVSSDVKLYYGPVL